MTYLIDRVGCECKECESGKTGCGCCLVWIGIIIFCLAFEWGAYVLGRWVWLSYLAPLIK